MKTLLLMVLASLPLFASAAAPQLRCELVAEVVSQRAQTLTDADQRRELVIFGLEEILAEMALAKGEEKSRCQSAFDEVNNILGRPRSLSGTECMAIARASVAELQRYSPRQANTILIPVLERALQTREDLLFDGVNRAKTMADQKQCRAAHKMVEEEFERLINVQDYTRQDYFCNDPELRRLCQN